MVRAIPARMTKHTTTIRWCLSTTSMSSMVVTVIFGGCWCWCWVASVGAFHGPATPWFPSARPPPHSHDSPAQHFRISLSATSNNMKNKKQGFGGGGGFGTASSSPSKKNKKASSSSNRLQDALNDTPKKSQQQQQHNKPYVKDEQSVLMEQLAQTAATTPIGRVVAEFAHQQRQPLDDPFWELLPSLIVSRFPNVPDAQLERLAGFFQHALATSVGPQSSPQRPVDWVDDPYRPYEELHAYMPGLGPTQPFHDPSTVPFCQLLEQNYATIYQEYQALLHDPTLVNKFQSVTSMNYESGWQTLVLFYNGHRIPNFPYHLCPVTTRLLETVPLAGRIAGFNRQQPQSGIPLHTDGNNLWLTTQMGMVVPDDTTAHITVGSETRHWHTGQCLLYDTTYQHETYNAHPTQERVVLHVDFFNSLALTPLEIEILQYIYRLREEFMKAEGVAKVGAQIL